MNEMQKKSEKKLSFLKQIREASPYILSCLWFFGSVLLGVLFATGLVDHSGDSVSLVTVFEFIADIVNISEEEILYYISRFLLGGLYVLYAIKILVQILKSLSSFKCVWNKEIPAESRTDAVLNLNQQFGSVFGMAMMYMIWARLLTSAVKTSGMVGVVIVGIAVFMATGLLLNYAYEKPNSSYYVLVDTARNAIVVLILCLLFSLLIAPFFEEAYGGVQYFFQALDNESLHGVRSAVYLLFHQICYPILGMIVALIYGAIFPHIAGNFNYFKRNKKEEKAIRRFRRIMIFAVVYAALWYVADAIGQGTIGSAFFRQMREFFIPTFLLGLAGTTTFRFSYPEKHATPKTTEPEDPEKQSQEEKFEQSVERVAEEEI